MGKRNSSSVAVADAVQSVDVVPIIPAPVPELTPAAPAVNPSLATLSGAEQAAAIVATCKAPHLKIAAAALADADGNVSTAAALVGPAVLPTLHLVSRIVAILKSTAPAALFTDGNNRGARVGELFASRFGLSSLYRGITRSDLKSARAALIEGAK